MTTVADIGTVVDNQKVIHSVAQRVKYGKSVDIYNYRQTNKLYLLTGPHRSLFNHPPMWITPQSQEAQ
jgi:hypothetical protein